MDDVFFQELDAHISNIGIDKFWKRRIGGIEVWLSPIPYTAQLKANETISNETLGVDAIQETKRVALSHSIVGFDSFDLRKWRDAGPQFTISARDERGERKPAKVELSRYIYEKIAGWDAEFVDSVFSVFSDLLESNKAEMTKDVRFENAKDPMDELVELEGRSAKIREELGMAQMTEIVPERHADEPEAAPPQGSSYRRRGMPREEQTDAGVDPFHPMPDPIPTPVPTRSPPTPTLDARAFPGDVDGTVMTMAVPVPVTAVPVISATVVTVPVVTVPVVTVPVPVSDSAKDHGRSRGMTPIERELRARGGAGHPASSILQPPSRPTSSPDEPYPATPSVAVEVVEAPAERKTVDPPRIDGHGGQSPNPRFVPQSRG